MGYYKRLVIEAMQPKEEPPMEVLLPKGYEMTITPQPWISVGERLPEDNGAVLVAAHEFEFFLGEPFTDQAHWFDGQFWTGESPAAKYPFHITHWMPLPEPPEVK